jgi:hypothetical protein
MSDWTTVHTIHLWNFMLGIHTFNISRLMLRVILAGLKRRPPGYVIQLIRWRLEEEEEKGAPFMND